MTEEQITNRYVRGWSSLAQYRADLVDFYDREDAREEAAMTTKQIEVYAFADLVQSLVDGPNVTLPLALFTDGALIVMHRDTLAAALVVNSTLGRDNTVLVNAVNTMRKELQRRGLKP